MPPEPPLFRRYPALRQRCEWLPLAAAPTPVELLAGAGPAGDVWIKRDDLSGRPYGGNKVRKLEFVLAEARRRGAGRLITAGAAGSHHALATAVYGAAAGFAVSLTLFPQPRTPHAREVLLLDAAYGAELLWVPRMELVPVALQLARLRSRRERPLLVAPGGSDAYGTLGYVNAGLELAEQVAAGALPEPSVVHVAAGTLGTAAGLALGFVLAGLRTRVRASRIASRLVANRWALSGLLRRTAALLRDAGLREPPWREALARVELRGEFIGRGYGHATAAGERAVARLAASGLALDATYTAKAAAALFDALERGEPGPHLFWHTLSAVTPAPPGGVPGPETLPATFRAWLGE